MRRPFLVTTLWLLAFATCGWIVARAHYSTDLSAFLPSAPDVRQRLLVKLLRDGPTSQLILISIERSDLATRARLSHELARALRKYEEFSSVANGEQASFDRDGAVLFRNRYLISQDITPERFTVSGLTQAMQANIIQQSAELGLLGADLLAHDPTGETQQILDQLDTSSHPRTAAGVWVSQDGSRAILMARTVASGADTEGQIRAIAIVRNSFSQLNSRLPTATTATMNLSGPGVFAAEARRTIQHEVGRLSGLSTLLIGTLLLLVYRSVAVLLLGFLPVICGALAGLAAVALSFNVVYGITLGFGITLIGEAVDYSIYFFVQAERNDTGAGATLRRNWTTSLWPVIRLGMLTSVCGFASLLPSAFPSLAQLGLYTIAGLVVAALVTRFLLPSLLHGAPYIQALEGPTRVLTQVIGLLSRARLLFWPLALLALAALFLNREQLWNRELSALSPVSLADQRRDTTLRADLGAADVSNLVAISSSDPERVLRAAEQVSTKLDTFVSSHYITGYDSPSRYLPSQATQQARRNSLPDETTLRVRTAAAANAVGLKVTELEPFIADVAAAQLGPLLSRKDLDGTSHCRGSGQFARPIRLQLDRTPSLAYGESGRGRSKLRRGAPKRRSGHVVDARRRDCGTESEEGVRRTLCRLFAQRNTFVLRWSRRHRTVAVDRAAIIHSRGARAAAAVTGRARGRNRVCAASSSDEHFASDRPVADFRRRIQLRAVFRSRRHPDRPGSLHADSEFTVTRQPQHDNRFWRPGDV